MEKKRTKGAAKKPMRAVEDAFGLPPAVESLCNDGPPKDPNAPSTQNHGSAKQGLRRF